MVSKCVRLPVASSEALVLVEISGRPGVTETGAPAILPILFGGAGA